MDNPRLVRMTVDCGMTVSGIGLAFCLRYTLFCGLDMASCIKGNPSRERVQDAERPASGAGNKWSEGRAELVPRRLHAVVVRQAYAVLAGFGQEQTVAKM